MTVLDNLLLFIYFTSPNHGAGVGTLPTISSPPYQAPHIRPPYQAPHTRPPISSPPYQTPHIKPPIASPVQYQDPISGHLFQYETADLPYQAPTYDIKPLVLDVQNEPPTYDIKLFELNLQYRKYQNRQPTISGHDQRYQAHRIRFSK